MRVKPIHWVTEQAEEGDCGGKLYFCMGFRVSHVIAQATPSPHNEFGRSDYSAPAQMTVYLVHVSHRKLEPHCG